MIRNRLATFKNRLFRIHDKEPLSKLSLCVIIALDVFILFMVFSGLNDHTRQLTAPQEYVPYECREVFIQQNWTEANRIALLQKLVLSDYHQYAYRHTSRFENRRIEKMHPVCKDFFLRIKAIAEDNKLFDLFKQREALEKAREAAASRFKQSKDVYDTSLLETIAEKDPTDDRLPTISDAMRDNSRQIERLNLQITTIENQLLAEEKIKALWSFLDANTDGRRSLLVTDIRNQEFWYPFKELLWQLLFLLPLFVLFYGWHGRSIRKNAHLQALVSAHLLVIAAIPILFKLLEVVLELIPRHFFKKFFALLEALHIVAVWHYLVIIASVGAALVAIYLIQKKIFNPRRLALKRLSKGLCRACGKKLPKDSDNCPFCGAHQHTPCPGCGRKTYAAGEFCTHCGKELE